MKTEITTEMVQAKARELNPDAWSGKLGDEVGYAYAAEKREESLRRARFVLEAEAASTATEGRQAGTPSVAHEATSGAEITPEAARAVFTRTTPAKKGDDAK